ncbi:sugar ABC transporter ATP-binding protein [Labrys wisconsinensis]|uniref:ABC-type sugar transport system ATPase subunit n=1 Tax=Labrys wisconsinensis TaxID=425677 RepID=A0ABU0JID2_9HYPH|nr:sugar ABC transporter ATP-binding protein [Labrys wisconsinensis]MDQ0474019.1 ABC-type sugar transport system ATPase subunit [Labrys wisconsinensis]
MAALGPAVRGAPAPALDVRGLSKAFAGVPVLKDVDFRMESGEITMLVGENGAGKSTLKNILCGVLRPDGGSITVAGERFDRLDGGRAEALGIGVVHQELSLFPNLSVSENLFIGNRPRPFGRVDWKGRRARARALLEGELDSAIDPDAPVESLSIGQRQLVEIAKAIAASSRILILDEPTTSLTAPEREHLGAVVRRLKAKGLAILYVTHFMDEIYALADRIVVLRDGRMVGGGTPAEIDRRALGTLMAGRALDVAVAALPPVAAGAPALLAVEDLDDGRMVHGVSFDLRAGEVLGLAGLVGAGRSEIAEAIVGLRPAAGRVRLAGLAYDGRSPRESLKRGLVLVSEDRRRDQAFLGRSVAENAAAALLGRVSGHLGLIEAAADRALVGEVLRRTAVSHPGAGAPMAALSGGNQQKVILGRWLAAGPTVAILDEPTKGVDIGARAVIHRLVVELARAGVAVLLISSDLNELLALSHRIAILHKGRLAATVDPRQTGAAAIVEIASAGEDAAP